MENTNIIFFDELNHGWIVDDRVINQLKHLDLRRELLIDALFERMAQNDCGLYDLEW
jgi:hypothetical protein